MINFFDDPDDSLWCWETMFINTLVNHVKARKVKVRSENQPWMTGTLRKSINNRFKLFNTAKLSANDPEIWKRYKKSRNYCTNAIRKAKAEHWKSAFQDANDNKSFWKAVKKFNGSSKSSIIGPLSGISDPSKIITEDDEKSNTMNTFFATVGKHLATKLPSTIDTSDNSYIYRVTPTISEIKPDIETFTKSFKSSVKIGKACGADNITARDLKLHELTSISGLFKVYQKSVAHFLLPGKLQKLLVSTKKAPRKSAPITNQFLFCRFQLKLSNTVFVQWLNPT